MRRALLLIALTSTARAATTELGPGDDAVAAMTALRAGDELVLRGGNYRLSGRQGPACRVRSAS